MFALQPSVNVHSDPGQFWNLWNFLSQKFWPIGKTTPWNESVFNLDVWPRHFCTRVIWQHVTVYLQSNTCLRDFPIAMEMAIDETQDRKGIEGLVWRHIETSRTKSPRPKIKHEKLEDHSDQGQVYLRLRFLVSKTLASLAFGEPLKIWMKGISLWLRADSVLRYYFRWKMSFKQNVLFLGPLL